MAGGLSGVLWAPVHLRDTHCCKHMSSSLRHAHLPAARRPSLVLTGALLTDPLPWRHHGDVWALGGSWGGAGTMKTM